jgi:hypothetical protein
MVSERKAPPNHHGTRIVRRLLRKPRIRPVIAERGQPHGIGLGTFHRINEQTIAWLHAFRRLRIR